MKRIAALAATATVLAIPAAAQANTIDQEGFIAGDKSATVRLRVKVTNGEAKKIGGFRVKNVEANCGKKVIRIQLTALVPVKVESDGGFKVRLPDGDGGVLRISGNVEDSGHSTVGSLKTNDFKAGDMTCMVSKQRFTTASN
ncbi:MAG: hypothetical protein H0V25_10280 [Solirubrobacterales bacterium]|nr:hypothetical protein [Solirubrobacterales bacterium]